MRGLLRYRGRIDDESSLPLPQDPTLAATAVAVRDTGQWADIIEGDWRWVYSTDDERRIYGGLMELAPAAIGSHYFGPEAMSARLNWLERSEHTGSHTGVLRCVRRSGTG